MKTIGLIVLMLVCASFASAQFTELYSVVDSTATTTWKKIEKSPYQKIIALEVANDNSTGSQVLYVAFEDDTTYNRRFALKTGEVLTMSNINVTHVYIRASTSTVTYRVRYH